MGRPPKNQDNFNADDLLNEIEALKAENAELQKQIGFKNEIIGGWQEKFNEMSIFKNTPRPTLAGIKITVDNSVFYKGTSYAKDGENPIIQNPPESDIDELLKFGELV